MITELIDLIIDDIKEKDKNYISDISGKDLFDNIISSIGSKESDLKENIKSDKM